MNEVKEAKRLDFEKVEEEEVGEGRRWGGQIVMVFRAKIRPKRLKQGFNGNTLIFFYFFCPIFSETRRGFGGIHVFLGIKT